ncbi:MAG: DEAD/DEAH box helicase, partial [bacterium]|nr:DEAD/DEAH box helicase [bacterium]
PTAKSSAPALHQKSDSTRKKTSSPRDNTAHKSENGPDTREKKSHSNSNRRPNQNRNRQNDRRENDRRESGPRHNNHRPHKPTPPPEPKKTPGKAFKEMALHPDILAKLDELGFTNSTEVQETSIPHTLNGKNIFCSSETGSGKTFSFLLPMIHKFYNKTLEQALVICPTREIAIQIEKTLQQLAGETITSALVIGGTNMALQKQKLREYPQVLVATPGRLLDMMSTGLIWLDYTGYVVLDEADRMLDMGFEDDLIKIHNQLSGNHQTVLFSATLFPEVKKMASRYAKDYEEIVIGNPTDVAGSVEHVIVEMPEKEKLEALMHLARYNRGKMMVFFNTVKETIEMTQQLRRNRVQRVDCIHSKISQQDRMRIIENFREGRTDVLLASDVASRGIDVPNVELVVNYNIPNNSEEYIHRVGRTGRAGNLGIAISFYSLKDKRKLDALETLLKGKIKRKNTYKHII